MFTWSTLLLAAATSAFAAPAARGPTFQPPTQSTGCSVPASVLQQMMPANQTTLVAPSSAPNFVALGVGVQNYTCSSTGTFTNIGAYAELFDISCLASTPAFADIQTKAYQMWNASPQTTTQQLVDAMGTKSVVLGQHYFVANPAGTGANVPKFDFTSDRDVGDAQAFAVMSKVGDIAAPTGSADVDWLMLNTTSGDLAKQIFRVSTVAGTDGATCTSGQSASVKYVAKYFFY